MKTYKPTLLQPSNFCQRPKIYTREKTASFNKLSYWVAACRRMKLDPYLLPSIKLSSKWIKDLNMRPESLLEKMGSTPELRAQEDFLGPQ